MLTVLLVLLVSLALVVALPVLALLALVVLDMASMDVMKLVCRYSFGAHLVCVFAHHRWPLLAEASLAYGYAPGTAQCKH